MAISRMQQPRQMYGLGSLVRKATRAVKKVVKSPVGKAALLGAATFGVPGTGFKGFLGGKGSIGSFFGKGSFNPLKAIVEKKGFGGLEQASGLAKLLGKFGLAEGTKLTGLGKIAGIGGLSGLAGLLAAQEAEGEDEIDISSLDRGEGLNIADIIRRARMNDPEFRFLPGSRFTSAYAKGGEVDAGAPEIKVKGDVRPIEEKIADRVKEMKVADMLDANDPMYKGVNPKIVKEFIEEGIPLGYDDIESYFEDFYGPIGLKDGGEVGTRDEELLGNLASQKMKGDEMREFKIMNPNVEDIADYKSYYEKLKKQDDNKKAKKRDKARTKKAEGGIMDLDGFEMDLRGGGFVPLGVAEKADDVPARLSKNEFVMTADAVRAAGGGSIEKGADKMYKTMKQLESMV